MDLFKVYAMTYDVNKKCSRLYFLGGEVVEVATSPRSILEKLCLMMGSSMQGRMDAFKHLVKVQKKVPVLVSQCRECIFFPTNGVNVEDGIWLQYKYIKKVTSVTTSKCIVHFNDGNEMVLPVGCRVIYKQLKRCREFFSAISSTVDSREIIDGEVCYTIDGDLDE